MTGWIHQACDYARPLKKAQFCLSSRKARISTTGIYWYFEDWNLSLTQKLGKRGCFAKVSMHRHH